MRKIHYLAFEAIWSLKRLEQKNLSFTYSTLEACVLVILQISGGSYWLSHTTRLVCFGFGVARSFIRLWTLNNSMWGKYRLTFNFPASNNHLVLGYRYWLLRIFNLEGKPIFKGFSQKFMHFGIINRVSLDGWFKATLVKGILPILRVKDASPLLNPDSPCKYTRGTVWGN